ncbi:MAG: Fe-S cluster assembly sulfur transfer protein SufU [Myxococcota bacterium]
MTDPRKLYPKEILEHSKDPHHQGKLADATHAHRLSNPLCGDRVTIAVRVVDDQIVEAAFEARGCALCVASASMLTDWVKGRTPSEVELIQASVCQAVDPEGPDVEAPVQVWTALRAFPARKRCATLPWEALAAALANQD